MEVFSMNYFSYHKITRVILLLAIGAALFGGSAVVRAASHSDAPLIKQDPQANLTDVYAFIGRRYGSSNQKVLNVIVHVRPFSEPGDGVIYDRFADDALYSIHITHPTTGATLLRYDFRFSSVTGSLKNKNTILSYGLGTQAGPIVNVGDARQIIFEPGHQRTARQSRQQQCFCPPPSVGQNTTRPITIKMLVARAT
jgi:hypothetical protein